MNMDASNQNLDKTNWHTSRMRDAGQYGTKFLSTFNQILEGPPMGFRGMRD